MHLRARHLRKQRISTDELAREQLCEQVALTLPKRSYFRSFPVMFRDNLR